MSTTVLTSADAASAASAIRGINTGTAPTDTASARQNDKTPNRSTNFLMFLPILMILFLLHF